MRLHPTGKPFRMRALGRRYHNMRREGGPSRLCPFREPCNSTLELILRCAGGEPLEKPALTHPSQSPAATAAALPPELPPAEYSLVSLLPALRGLLTGPNAECVECELEIPRVSMGVLCDCRRRPPTPCRIRPCWFCPAGWRRQS